jgi:hypothetical protein
MSKIKLAEATESLKDLLAELEDIMYSFENEIDSDEEWESVLEELEGQSGTISTIITKARGE